MFVCKDILIFLLFKQRMEHASRFWLVRTSLKCSFKEHAFKHFNHFSFYWCAFCVKFVYFFIHMWIFYFSVESNSRVIKISLYKWFQDNICVVLEGFICTIFKTIKCDIIAWTLHIILLTWFFSTIIHSASHVFHCTLKII